MGYSQGGQASSWAAELAPAYAPGLHVKGTAAGGVPADLPKVAASNDGDEDAALVLMSAIGHDAAHPGLHLEKYLNDEGAALAEPLREGCVAEETAAGAGKSVDERAPWPPRSSGSPCRSPTTSPRRFSAPRRR